MDEYKPKFVKRKNKPKNLIFLKIIYRGHNFLTFQKRFWVACCLTHT